jgi:8-oxo-dGTP diphosphatase
MALWHLGDNFASDIVVIAGVDREQKLLLIRRKHAPFKDFWALPGGFVNSLTPPNTIFEAAETHVQTAVRELQEETGIVVQEVDFKFIDVYDAFGRDPIAEGNQRMVTEVFLYRTLSLPQIQAGDDAAEAQWFNLDEVVAGKVALAFDHIDMVHRAQHFLAVI